MIKVSEAIAWLLPIKFLESDSKMISLNPKDETYLIRIPKDALNTESSKKDEDKR
jgi:hypothetical protein